MGGFAVLGPGGVGGFLAAALARAGESVTVVARAQTAAAIQRDGIILRSAVLGDFTARPAAVVTSLNERVGVLFVTTKATGLEAALERIEAAPDVVVPLLNGLEHLTVLRERFGAERVPAAVIRIESYTPERGVVVQSSPVARVDVAAGDPVLAARLPPLVESLEAAGLRAHVGRSESHVMWSKLVRLNALSATTTAAQQPLGYIRTEPDWRARLIACAEEGAAVACADGGEVTAAAAIGELERAPATLSSSMQRDVAASRTPELDAIQGAVLRAAARHGIACPVTAELARRIAVMAGIQAPATTA